MEYRLARTYEEQGYTIATDSIEEENGKLYAEIICKCYIKSEFCILKH